MTKPKDNRGGNHNPTGKKAPAVKDKQEQFRCSQDFKDFLQEQSELRGLSKGDLLIEAVYFYTKIRPGFLKMLYQEAEKRKESWTEFLEEGMYYFLGLLEAERLNKEAKQAELTKQKSPSTFLEIESGGKMDS